MVLTPSCEALHSPIPFRTFTPTLCRTISFDDSPYSSRDNCGACVPATVVVFHMIVLLCFTLFCFYFSFSFYSSILHVLLVWLSSVLFNCPGKLGSILETTFIHRSKSSPQDQVRQNDFASSKTDQHSVSLWFVTSCLSDPSSVAIFW